MTNVQFSYTLTRRAMLRALLGGITLATCPLVYASPQKRTPWRVVRRALERPLTAASGTAASNEAFTPEQADTIRYLVELIIPSDTTPGAYETGSADFVLANLASQDAWAIEAVNQAIAAIDELTMQAYGQPFRDLPPDAAHQVATAVSTHPQLAIFWHSMRSLTVLHFYAHPQGYRPLGLPGPSIDLGGFPGGISAGGSVFCPVA